MNQFVLTNNHSFKKKLENWHVIDLFSNWSICLFNENFTLYENNNKKLILLGDYWGVDNIIEKQSIDLIKQLKGHFYLIEIINNQGINVFTSVFNVLPVYYSQNPFIISSSFQIIKNIYPSSLIINKKFILELILFNYGFFNRTFYENITLLESNSFIKIGNNDSFRIIKHTYITDFFSTNLIPEKKAKEYISELFIETSKDYFPSNPFSITFTSGFDGRTLVACARHHKKQFRTCSFGVSGNDDVEIPYKNSKQLGLIYDFYSLQNPVYIEREYIFYGKILNKINPGYNGFIYPHFVYLASQESKVVSHLITGIFGSEIFRALHLTGAVSSDVLIKLFNVNNDIDIRNYILLNPRLNVLKIESFQKELSELIEQLIVYKNSLSSGLTKNQKLYVFVFEEILRKVFGTWVNSQLKYINVRTPYTDFDFIKEILKTSYAGANNDFYTNNPLKRFKGQVIYGEIIRRTDPGIYRQMTGKGYKPSALVEPFGSFKILLPFINKRLKRKFKKTNLDNLSIISGCKANHEYFNNLFGIDNKYFNSSYLANLFNELSPYTPEMTRDLILHSASIIDTYNSNDQNNCTYRL